MDVNLVLAGVGALGSIIMFLGSAVLRGLRSDIDDTRKETMAQGKTLAVHEAVLRSSGLLG